MKCDTCKLYMQLFEVEHTAKAALFDELEKKQVIIRAMADRIAVQDDLLSKASQWMPLAQSGTPKKCKHCDYQALTDAAMADHCSVAHDAFWFPKTKPPSNSKRQLVLPNFPPPMRNDDGNDQCGTSFTDP